MSHAPVPDTLHIDWIPTALWPGRLGLTQAPGQPGRDMAADMAALAREGTNILAPLLLDEEFSRLGMNDYHAQAEARSLTVAPCPIQNGSVPDDQTAFAAYVDELMDQLLDGRNLVLHCRGGVGRAGLVAACLLVQAGMPADAATNLVRATRHPSALENAAQVQFLHDFEDRLTRR